MSTPVKGETVKSDLVDAFKTSYFTYFNDQLLEGALTIPMGMNVEFKTNVYSMKPLIRATDVIKGLGGKRIEAGVRGLFVMIMDRRQVYGQIPVFRAKPVIEVRGLDRSTMTWDVGIWCDMAWIDPKSNVKHFNPAWRA